MKRLVGFCLFIIVLICLFLLFSKRTKDYELDYEEGGYTITEKFVKEDKNYYFNLGKDGRTFDFVVNHKYSTKRRIVSKVDEVSKDDYTCVSIKVFKESLPYVCTKDGNYVDGYVANVVSKDEEKVLKNIKELVNGKTCIIISNRISDVKDSDHIIVLDSGKIIEEGTHNELLNNNGLYNKFYNQQSSNNQELLA